MLGGVTKETEEFDLNDRTSNRSQYEGRRVVGAIDTVLVICANRAISNIHDHRILRHSVRVADVATVTSINHRVKGHLGDIGCCVLKNHRRVCPCRHCQHSDENERKEFLHKIWSG